jgi:hypothetical protein
MPDEQAQGFSVGRLCGRDVPLAQVRPRYVEQDAGAEP